MMGIKVKKLIKPKYITVLSLFWLGTYRLQWSSFAYWGVDSATNLWLGYTKNINELSVGLISSQFIPNPNGMMLIGKVLSYFSSLIHVSNFLTLLNLLIVYIFLKNLLLKTNIDFYILLFFAGSSILISSTVIEFWNQWILLTINVAILSCLIGFLNKKKGYYIYICIFLLPLPVFVYLGGLTNSIVFGLILIFIVFKYLKNGILDFKNVAFYTIISFLFYWIISFSSFFENISLQRLTTLNRLSLLDRFKYLINNILKLPDALLNTWAKKDKIVIFQIDEVIISTRTKNLLDIFYQFHKLIPFIALIILLTGIYHGVKSKENYLDTRTISSFVIILFYTSFSLVISPIYGGPDFLIIQEKANNLNQYYFFFILIWYLLPKIFNNYKNLYLFENLNRIIFVIFTILNLSLGLFIINDQRNFASNQKTLMEAPINNQILVADFIANEWEKKSDSNQLLIYYKVFVNDMEWFDNHTKAYEEYYKPSPYTEGRSIDYQLFRRYDLENINNQISFDEADFIVTNNFEKEPYSEEKKLTHKTIGQLRVSW